MHVSTLIGVSLYVEQVYHICPVMLNRLKTLADLVIFDMEEFDIIFGMSWLSIYHVFLDCYAKIVTLEIPKIEKLEWEGTFRPTHARIL